MFEKEYKYIISSLKTTILKSRYKVAAIANREMLSLYFEISPAVSDQFMNDFSLVSFSHHCETSAELPDAYKNILPDAEMLKNLWNNG